MHHSGMYQSCIIKITFFKGMFTAIFGGKSFENVCPIVYTKLMYIFVMHQWSVRASLYFARELVLRWRLW